MNLIFTESLSIETILADISQRVQACQSFLYTHLMRRLKKITTKPVVKMVFRFNRRCERVLKSGVGGLRVLEETMLFKGVYNLSVVVVQVVQRDGLKLTFLLTLLGYGIWCLVIF